MTRVHLTDTHPAIVSTRRVIVSSPSSLLLFFSFFSFFPLFSFFAFFAFFRLFSGLFSGLCSRLAFFAGFV
jgi:hypothetical protein